MTVEEALLALVGLVALVLLFLGLVQVLEGDPRIRLRNRRRRLARLGLPRAEARPEAARRPRTRTTPDADRAVPVEPPDLPAATIAAVGASTPAPDPEALGWREQVAGRIRRREFGEARGLVDPVLTSGRLTVDGTAFLLEVCSTAIARDLWRLRRGQRRGTGEEAPLIAAMDITQVILDSETAASVDAAQRERVARRLWRGQTRLGLRRWRAGDFEAAVDALFRALAVPGIGERRRRLARDLLVRTLEDMAGQSLELIPQLRGEGDRAAALEQAQRVLEHIRRARTEGLPAEDLAVAASRARQLLEQIEPTSVQ